MFKAARMALVTDTAPTRDVAVFHHATLPPTGTVPDTTAVRQGEGAKADAFLREQRVQRHR